MSTPESMKFLGGKGDKINKNHLTPCRRLGLSRKTKTTPSGALKVTPAPAVETQAKQPERDKTRQKRSSDSAKPAPSQAKKPKEEPPVEEAKPEPPPSRKKKDKTPAKQPSFSDESQSSCASVALAMRDSCKVQRRSSDADSDDSDVVAVGRGRRSAKAARVLSDSEGEEENQRVVIKPEPKKLRKSLSLKTNSPASQRDNNSQEFLSAAIMEADENEKGRETPALGAYKTAPPDNRVIDCDDEGDDFQPAAAATGKETEADLEDKIREAWKRIKEKEDEISKLKQVSIYQKKHNIEELRASTMVWKIACKEALRDLFVALNRHSKIEMGTLLGKLGVPDDVISCTPNGTLV